jgi:hypothetical protein
VRTYRHGAKTLVAKATVGGGGGGHSTASIACRLLLLTTLVMSACYEATSPVRARLALILPDTGTADGASLLHVSAIVDTTGLDASKRSIALTTTGGVFTMSGTASATMAVDARGQVLALLRAPSDSTTVLVTATSNGESTTHEIVFRRAMPDRIELVPDQSLLVAGPGHTLMLAATVRRVVGTPSTGLVLVFTADSTASTGRITSVFLPSTATTDASGVVHVQMTVPDTAARGPLIVRATVSAAGVTGAVTVNLTGP